MLRGSQVRAVSRHCLLRAAVIREDSSQPPGAVQIHRCWDEPDVELADKVAAGVLPGLQRASTVVIIIIIIIDDTSDTASQTDC